MNNRASMNGKNSDTMPWRKAVGRALPDHRRDNEEFAVGARLMP